MLTFPCLLLNFVPSAFIINGKCAYCGGTQLNALKSNWKVADAYNIEFAEVVPVQK